MLTTKILYSAGETKRYYSADRSKDYYVSEDRQVVVSGKLMEQLGITGFEKQQFFDLCDGLVPGSRTEEKPDGMKLTPRPKKGDKRRVALDMTISAPKSVTEAMLVLGDERLFDAMSRANQDVLRLQEADMAVRERSGGADHDRPTGNHIVYSFWDPTTRPEDGEVDPHGHWHNVIINATFDPVKGRIMAAQLQRFDDNGLKLYRPYYQAYFNNQLRRYVEELGYKTRDTEFAFEIGGIPQAAIDEMSRRTQKIDAAAQRLGITDPEKKGKLGAKLRQGKIDQLPWDRMVARWKERLGPDNLAAMEAVKGEALKPHAIPELENQRAMTFALEHKQYRQSALPERELLIEAMKFRMGRTSLDGLRHELGRPGIIQADREGVKYVTSKEIEAEENAVIQFANSRRGAYEMLGKRGWKVPARIGPHKATKSQKAAIKHILGSKDPVTLVLGKPGAGKTEVLKAVRPQLRTNSVFIAPTATASRENLVEAGFSDAETVAAFLRSEELQERARGGVVFLDEGSLAGSKDAAELANKLRELGARLVVVGDLMQHRSASRGDTLKLLVKHAKLPYAHLSEIVRQKGELLEAVEMFHAGDGAGGIRELDRQGRIRVGTVEDLAEAYLDAATTVDKKGARKRAKETPIVISPTHAGGRAAAEAIRQVLKVNGLVGRKDQLFETLTPLQWTPAQMREYIAPGQIAQFYMKAPGGFQPGDRVPVTPENIERIRAVPMVGKDRNKLPYSLHVPDTTPVAVGDRIRTTINKDVEGGRMTNGSLYEVAKTKNGAIYTTNGLVLPAGFQNFTQGYVGTSPARQSKTSKVTLVWQPASTQGATNLEQALVTSSRPTDELLVFTDRKDWLPKAADRREERVLAHDLKISRKKTLKQRVKGQLAQVMNLGDTFRKKEPERGVQKTHDRGLHRE